MSRIPRPRRAAAPALAFALPLLLDPALGEAQDFFPFRSDLLRTYASTVDTVVSHYSTRFDQRSSGGDTLHALHFASGEDDGLVQLWRETAAHDKFLCGFEIVEPTTWTRVRQLYR